VFLRTGQPMRWPRKQWLMRGGGPLHSNSKPPHERPSSLRNHYGCEWDLYEVRRGPNGSGGDSGHAALSNLKVTVTGGTFPPPGNIIFNSAVSCGVVSCICQVAYQINTANAPYTLLPMAIGLTPATSNSAAQAMTSSCTLNVSYPFNAPGANP
jgi:hypothetical protein